MRPPTGRGGWRTSSAASSCGGVDDRACGARMDLFLAGCQGAGLAVAAGALAGASGRRGTPGVVLLVLAVIGGAAALFGIALANEDHPAWPGWPVGAAPRASPSSSPAISPRAPPGGRQRRLHSRADRARRARPRRAVPAAAASPRRSRWRCCGVVYLGRRGATRRPQVRRPADVTVTTRKLVLCVVDSLRTDMLTRGGSPAAWRPTFAALLERGSLIADCVSSFPSVTPVCNSEIVTGERPDRHWISGMQLVPPRRAPLRRVRELVRGDARVRPLPDPLRHRLQHEHGPPLRRGGDGVRAARRPRPAHRVHARS